MEDFVTLFIIGILILCIYIKYESKHSEVVFIKSTIDNKTYLVRNLPDKQKAANLLAEMNINILKLSKFLKKKDPNDIRTKRLIKKYNSDNISESSSSSKYTSYSVNKGEKIVFCIRSRDEHNKLVNINTLMFVALHEIAHVITKSVGHTEEFWDNFKWILEKSLLIHIYKKHDYRNKPVKYCGIEITDSPLYA